MPLVHSQPIRQLEFHEFHESFEYAPAFHHASEETGLFNKILQVLLRLPPQSSISEVSQLEKMWRIDDQHRNA